MPHRPASPTRPQKRQQPGGAAARRGPKAPRPAPPPLAAGVAARQIAWLVLQAIGKGQTLEEALAASQWASLESRDRALVQNLLYVTLRHQQNLADWYLPRLATPDKLPAHFLPLLALALAQLFYLQTPPHAVIATTLALADLGHLGSRKKILHALLAAASQLQPLPATLTTPTLPSWLTTQLSTDYGAGAVPALAAALLSPAPLDLSCKHDAASWATHLGGTLLPGGSVRLNSAGEISQLPGYAEGAWWVQDAAACWPIAQLGSLQGQQVLEIGAAPGGKTAQLALAGASLTALEKSAARARLWQANMTRLQLEVPLVVADALSWDAPTTYDLIVLDAPCSASGTIRRHPDLLWRKDASNISRQQALQAKLLARTAPWVRVGGRLLYIVCSLAKAEGEAQINQFLAEQRGFARVPLPPPALGQLTPAGDWQSLPTDLGHAGGLDGFYAALLCRKA